MNHRASAPRPIAGWCLATVAGLLMAGCSTPVTSTAPGAITIERQGSFYVGGRQLTAEGTFDPTASASPPNGGQTYWVDQMYVQYQVPPHARKLPLVLVHGGGGTGRVWETTPDGREGFQSIFLRRGHPVYIVDAPRGGRSGFPSFNGEFGKLDDKQQVVANRTARPGREHAWSRFRLGPAYPQVFPVQAFPMEGLDQFMKHTRPLVSDDPEVVSRALVELVDKIGPSIVVLHSNGGLWGWLAAARSSNIRGIVAYEPGYVFPEGEMPPALPLFKGTQPAGTAITAQEFSMLAKIPVQVVFGDNIPKQRIPDLVADGRRAQVATSMAFVDALNQRGGKASVLHLPDVGVRGNSHYMFSDLNNLQVADQLSLFMAKHGLDAR